ncbi:MAG: hypothetical protein K2G00_03375 [Duncaniella sp.]|nr:hypothetical protein [Duncaniella sp.]
MKTPLVISSRVIDTINSLQPLDRTIISNALSMEFILGQTLTPMQSIIYAVIRYYVTQDSKRHIDNIAAS